VGAKLTVTGTLLPEGTVSGNETPLNEYPWPFQSAAETCTSPLVADNVAVSDLLLPTATLPKLIVAGVTFNVAWVFDPDPPPVPAGLVAAFGLPTVPAQPAIHIVKNSTGASRYRGVFTKHLMQRIIAVLKRPY
jgi:hypothetical protein